MDIPQGNRLDDGLEQQLEIGMSRGQVEFLLGSPAIIDLYRPDYWYYYYYLKTGDKLKAASVLVDSAAAFFHL
jgi:outer membrane protein assembly factor BamE